MDGELPILLHLSAKGLPFLSCILFDNKNVLVMEKARGETTDNKTAWIPPQIKWQNI
jgi:hypothetical protein